MVSYVIMVSYIIIIGHHGLLGKYTQYQHVRRWVCPWASPVQRAGVTSWEGQREEEGKRQCISGLEPLKIPTSELCDEWFQLLLHHTTTHPSIHLFPTRPTTYSPCHPSIHWASQPSSFSPPFELRPIWKGPAKSWGRVLGGGKSKDIGLRLEWAWWIYRSAWPGSSWDEMRLQGGWDQIRWTWSANGGFWICSKCEKSLEGFEQDSGVLLFPFHQDCSEWWKDCGGRSRERG